MPPQKPPMPMVQRRAYHEAGHAVMAAENGIPIERVSLKRLPGRFTLSTFQSAADYCPLQIGRPADERKLELYLLFLVSGSTAEMLVLELYHEFTGRIATRNRFRNHWHDVA